MANAALRRAGLYSRRIPAALTEPIPRRIVSAHVGDDPFRGKNRGWGRRCLFLVTLSRRSRLQDPALRSGGFRPAGESPDGLRCDVGLRPSGKSARSPEQSFMNTSLHIKDGDTFRPASFDELLDATRKALAVRVRKGAAMESPRAVRDFLLVHLARAEREIFTVIFLDNRHRLIEASDLFMGTIDGASVHPREVVKAALQRNASAVILAHNHPSGVAEPSRADELITLRLKDAMALVDIRVLDHLIVAGDTVTSLAERGLI